MEDWSRYADIIDLEHFEPKDHPRMSAMDRASQFAPFAALTGYDAMVMETARLTDTRIELDAEQMMMLNETLTQLISRVNEHPSVTVTWFRQDARKSGGAYVRTSGLVRDVELPSRRLILRSGQVISLDDILSLQLV